MPADGIRQVAADLRVIDPDLVAAEPETGASPLTPRETDALREAENGTSTEDTGVRLALAPATVRNYLSNAISKTGAPAALTPSASPATRDGPDLAALAGLT
jgi:two-component system response regulator DesR